MKKRVAWLDVLKCIGIIEIFLGHLPVASTHLGAFVWSNHVPLFFFVSGCVASKGVEPFFPFLKKKASNLLLPWFNFCILACVFFVLSAQLSGADLVSQLIMIAKGTIRDTFIAGSLWFLTCLFVISLVFEVIKRVNNRIIIFIVCLVVYVGYFSIEGRVSSYHYPSLWWNLDSAARYLLYYALGWLCFDFINSQLSKKRSKKKAIVFFSLSTISVLYSVAIFFERNPFLYLKTLVNIPEIAALLGLFKTLLVLWTLILLAYLLRKNSFLAKLGQNTLFACGNEQITKAFVYSCFSFLGITLNFSNPVVDIVYIVLLLVFIQKVISPVEQKLFEKERSIMRSLFKKDKKTQD